jgi:hypothetical protein
MIDYFKELNKQCEAYHNKPSYERLNFLYDMGFDYAETSKIMSHRRFMSQRKESIIKELDSGVYCTRIGVYRGLKTSSAKLSQVLNGDVEDEDLIDRIERMIKRAKYKKK